jgi:hypothetical protein
MRTLLHRTSICSAIAAGALSILTSPAGAQAFAGALVLQDPVSVRATAMGLTGAADNSDPANVWFNPANVVGPTRAYVDYGFWKLDAFYDHDLQYSRWTAGGSFPVGDADLGVSATFGEFDYGTSILTDTQGNELGEFETWERYVSLVAGAAVGLGDRVDLRLGMAGKRYWAEYAPPQFTQDGLDYNPEGFAFDVGTTVAMPTDVSGWTVTPALAFAYVNWGGEIEFEDGSDDPFPARLHYGASVRADGPETALGPAHVPLLSFVYNVAATDKLHGDSYSWGMGTELAVMQILFLRAGIDDEQDDNDYDLTAWSIGLGAPVGPFHGRFDYARVRSLEEPRYDFAVSWEF